MQSDNIHNMNFIEREQTVRYTSFIYYKDKEEKRGSKQITFKQAQTMKTNMLLFHARIVWERPLYA